MDLLGIINTKINKTIDLFTHYWHYDCVNKNKTEVTLHVLNESRRYTEGDFQCIEKFTIRNLAAFSISFQ